MVFMDRNATEKASPTVRPSDTIIIETARHYAPRCLAFSSVCSSQTDFVDVTHFSGIRGCEEQGKGEVGLKGAERLSKLSGIALDEIGNQIQTFYHVVYNSLHT